MLVFSSDQFKVLPKVCMAQGSLIPGGPPPHILLAFKVAKDWDMFGQNQEWPIPPIPALPQLCSLGGMEERLTHEGMKGPALLGTSRAQHGLAEVA